MEFRRAHVTSQDGTSIGYRAYDGGATKRPGCVLVHGGMQSAASFSRLAAALAADFAVYVHDRRGRGASGPPGPRHGFETEVADLRALLAATGARRVFGLSSGALIALAGALAGLPIDKLALYEPPLPIDGIEPGRWGRQFVREIDRGRLGAALATMLKGTSDVSLMTFVPRVVLVPLLGMALRYAPRKSGEPSVADLVPTMRWDIALVRESPALAIRIDELRCDTLLLGGARSTTGLRRIVDAIAAHVPKARRVTFARAGHTLAADDGRPAEVAAALCDFFMDPAAPAQHRDPDH